MIAYQFIRVACVVLLVCLAAWTIHSFGTIDPVALRSFIAQYPLAPIFFLLLHIPASVLFLPRTVVAVTAGFVFGPFAGFCLALGGAVLGGVAGFYLARLLSKDVFTLDQQAKLAPYIERAAKRGWISVALFRLIPGIHHSLANYLLGMAPIRLRSFVLGSAIAQIPSTALYIYAAWQAESLIAQGVDCAWWSLVSLAIGVGLIGVLLAWRLRSAADKPAPILTAPPL